MKTSLLLRSLVIVVREIQKTEKLLIDFLYENQFKIIGISVVYVYIIVQVVGLILITRL